MSKFNKFIEKAKSININHFQSDKNIHSYFLNNIKQNIKKTAFLSLLVSLSSSALSAEISFSKDDLQHALKNRSKIESTINEYKEKGMIDLENVKISFLNENNNKTSSTHILGDQSTCKISVSLNNNGDFQKLNKNQKFFDQDLYREMVFNHELSHCITNKEFKSTSLSKSSESWIQNWLVGEYTVNNNVKLIFEENYADVNAALILLNKHNFSKESVNFIIQWEKEREKANLEQEQNGNFFLGHNTSPSLKVVIKNIDRLKKLPTEEYNDIASELASKSVLYSLSEYRKIEAESIINDEGDLVSSGIKNNLGNKGIKLKDQIIDNYMDNVYNYALILSYKRNDEIYVKNSIKNSEIANITYRGMLYGNSFKSLENVEIDKNGDIGIKMNTKDFYSNFNNMFYNSMMASLKNEKGYKEFIKEFDSKLQEPNPYLELNIQDQKLEKIFNKKVKL